MPGSWCYSLHLDLLTTAAGVVFRPCCVIWQHGAGLLRVLAFSIVICSTRHTGCGTAQASMRSMQRLHTGMTAERQAGGVRRMWLVVARICQVLLLHDICCTAFWLTCCGLLALFSDAC